MAQLLVDFHRKFRKQFEKLPERDQERFHERLALFRRNPDTPLLHNHGLTGQWLGFFSIDITGGIRAIYTSNGTNRVMFIAIGTHAQLYR